MDLQTFDRLLERLVLRGVAAGLELEVLASSLRYVASCYAGDVAIECYRGVYIRCNGGSFYGDGAGTDAEVYTIAGANTVTCATVAKARAEIDAGLAWREAGRLLNEEVAALPGDPSAP
jgi:hypothetical protein